MMNQIPISEASLLKELELDEARNDLLSFIEYTNPNYHANWHHKLICSKLDEFMRSPDKNRLMVFVGPRRGKSEIVSRRFPAYFFGHNPDAQIIATSYGAELAQAMNRDVQRVIDSPNYQELFPETALSGKNVKTTSLGNYIRTSDKCYFNRIFTGFNCHSYTHIQQMGSGKLFQIYASTL